MKGKKKKSEKSSSIRFKNSIPLESHVQYKSLSRKENDPSNGYLINHTSVHSFKIPRTFSYLQGRKKKKRNSFNATTYLDLNDDRTERVLFFENGTK